MATRLPSDFTPEELCRLYYFVRYANGPFISDHKGLYWGLPAMFTLQEARDFLGATSSVLNKMRTVKIGTTKMISKAARTHNSWGVYRPDPALEGKIAGLEHQSEQLKQQIDSLAGGLMKQRAEVMDCLKALKESRTKT